MLSKFRREHFESQGLSVPEESFELRASGGELRASGGDPGVSDSNFLLGLAGVAAIVVVGALLLRPVMKDADERHRWNMEHDKVYRASHQAQEIAYGASNVLNAFR